MNPKIVYLILRVALITCLLWAVQPNAVFAGGVVGTGTPASCTEVALDAALAGGGVVTFDCGAAPHIIPFSSPKAITLDTTVDGGGTITLSGQDATRLFEVSGGAALILRNIVLTNGFSSGNGGAIHNGSSGSDTPGSVTLENSVIRNSRSSLSGGAIVSTGPLTITNSLLENNQALNGGALYPRFAGAQTTIINSTLRYNWATDLTNGWGGALLVWDGAAVTIQDGDIFSNTATGGGGIYAFTNSTLTLNGSTLRDNQALGFFGGGLLNAGTATLTDVTLSGNSASNGGGLYNEGTATLEGGILSGNTAAVNGGGLFNSGVVAQKGVTFSRNSASQGGGLYNDGPWATLTSVTFSGNSARDYGGGLYNVSGAATLNDVTFNGNESRYLGGGLFNDSLGTATLINVTLTGNTAIGLGGGLLNGGTATLINVTVSGNTANYGGGINNNFGRAALFSVTLSGNSASKLGGGIYNSSSATVTLKNSIVAYSLTGGNCGGGALTNNNSDQYSLSSDSTCALGGPGSQNNVDPLLTALGHYGGPTQVHLLKLGSPAIDGVSGSAATATDQRGKPRPQGGGYDIGAVERQPNDSDLAPRVYLPLVIK
jgi:predicted outer membrane repeat protein